MSEWTVEAEGAVCLPTGVCMPIASDDDFEPGGAGSSPAVVRSADDAVVAPQP